MLHGEAIRCLWTFIWLFILICIHLAGPDGSFDPVATRNSRDTGFSAGSDIFHRGCAYTVLQTVQKHGVHSAVYGAVHYKDDKKTLEVIR